MLGKCWHKKRSGNPQKNGGGLCSSPSEPQGQARRSDFPILVNWLRQNEQFYWKMLHHTLALSRMLYSYLPPGFLIFLCPMTLVKSSISLKSPYCIACWRNWHCDIPPEAIPQELRRLTAAHLAAELRWIEWGTHLWMFPGWRNFHTKSVRLHATPYNSAKFHTASVRFREMVESMQNDAPYPAVCKKTCARQIANGIPYNISLSCCARAALYSV